MTKIADLKGMRELLVVVAFLLGGVVQAQESTASFFDHDHAAWNALLQEHVHEAGLVDYVGLQEKRASFDAYLGTLQQVKAKDFAKWTGLQREAFWINAYNAYTIQLILDNYPVDSIKDMGGLFSSVFSKRFIPLQHLVAVDRRAEASRTKALSLGEVEHEILFPISRTPLFHFAIVCASISCPELRKEAYTASKLDEQLADQARVFLRDPSKNEQKVARKRLYMSKIFDWSEDEFETYPGGIRKIWRDFGPTSAVEDPGFPKAKIKYLNYDWSLNAWLPKD